MNGVLSPSASRLGIIGNPENRRVRDFQKTAVEFGLPLPPCLSYEEILREPDTLSRFRVDLIRIDSPGENAEVARGLIKLGGGPVEPQQSFGEISFLREFHLGFCRVLQWIESLDIPCVNSPREIGIMFDKWRCHQIFKAHDIARPPAQLAPSDYPTLHELMQQREAGRIFLKPLHGSSASGVCALRWNGEKRQLIAPLKIQAERGESVLVNSLRVQTYTADIELILGTLLPQGMIIESWIPKLTLPGGAVDLRVLVIAGQARHWVVRQSRHPMTNLHLGNARGNGESLREALGEEKFEAALRLAERAAACFPQSLYAGVDILLDVRGRPLVGEINAFGDLLPGLVHNGETAYAAIAATRYA